MSTIKLKIIVIIWGKIEYINFNICNKKKYIFYNKIIIKI